MCALVICRFADEESLSKAAEEAACKSAELVQATKESEGGSEEEGGRKGAVRAEATFVNVVVCKGGRRSPQGAAWCSRKGWLEHVGSLKGPRSC